MDTPELDTIGAKIHKALAENMLSRLTTPVLDEEGNEVPLSAAEWSAIAKFLHDNGINFKTLDPKEPVAKLTAALPFADPDTRLRAVR